MPQIFLLANCYRLDTMGGVTIPEQATAIRESVAAATVLRRCVGDVHDMRLLRSLVASAQRTEYITTMTDVGVVDLAARLVGQGRVQMLFLIPALQTRLVGSIERDEAPAATAAPSPPPPRTREVETVPSFRGDLDIAALIAALIAAAKDGTPFCEECARAARAA